MATTFVEYTGDGQASKQFTFPSYQESDVKVRVDGVLKTTSTHYNITNYTTTGGGNVVFTSGNIPSSPAKIRIYRDTSVDVAKATYTAGSSVKAADLNNNNTQLLYRAQEEQVPNLIQSYDIDTGAIETSNIKADAIVNSKIADDQIDSEHYVAGSIDLEHMSANSIDSDQYVDGSIDEVHLSNSAVTQNKLANNSVGTPELINGSVNSDKILDGTIVNADVNASAAIAGTKISPNFGSQNIVTTGTISTGSFTTSGTIDGRDIAADGTKLDGIESGATADQTASEIKTLLQSDKLTASEIATGALDGRYFTETELTNGALDGRYFTETESDARYFNISSGETIKDGDTFPDNDTTIATTAAINDRIIDLIDDVGGFDIIQSEQHFPNTNPQGTTGQSAVLSIKAASTNLVPSGTTVTISNGNLANNANITITGVTSTIPTGFGFLVESTSTTHTYAFHRLVPKATEVTTVASNISNINSAANNESNINAAVSNASNINAAVSNASNITAVAGNASNINAAVSNASNINSAVSNASNITTTASNITNVNNVGNNVTNVNSVSNSAGANQTFTVTVQNVSGNKYFIDGVQTPVLKLARGKTYTFDMSDSSNSGHPLAFRDSSDNAYTTGVTTSGTAGSSGATVVIVVAANAPSSLKYYCTSHGNAMGNTITVIDDNIGTVAGSIANVNTTAGSIANVNTTAGSISNVNTVASNISNVNSFFNVYRIGSNNPTSSLDVGDLFFNTTSNSLKVYTGSAWVDGVTATGNFAVVTGNTFTGSNIHNDNVKSLFGTGSDMQIFHNGTDSVITNGTGDLYINNNADIIIKPANDCFIKPQDGENGISVIGNGAVELYYDNSKKFQTTSSGTTITGDLLLDSSNAEINIKAGVSGATGAINWTFNTDSTDYSSIKLPYTTRASDGLVIDGGSYSVSLKHGSEYLGKFAADGAVTLYYDNSDKFITTNTGVEVYGKLVADEVSLETALAGSQKTLKLKNTNASAGTNEITFSSRTSGTDFEAASIRNGVPNTGNGTLQFKTNNGSGLQQAVVINSDQTTTFNAGIGVTGNITVSGTVDGVDIAALNTTVGNITTDVVTDTTPQLGGDLQSNGNDIDMADSDVINFGTGNDYQIFHDGTNSIQFFDAQVGAVRFRTDRGNSTRTNINLGAGVDLYYDNSKKLETVSTGTQIVGDLTFSGATSKAIRLGDNNRIYFGAGEDAWIGSNGSNGEVSGSLFYYNHQHYYDGVRIRMGNSQDLELYHVAGQDSYVDSNSGQLYIRSDQNVYIQPNDSENGIVCIANGSTELYHDNTKMAYTSSAGFDVTNGDLRSHLDIKVLNDSRKLMLGASNDLQLYHDGNHSHIKNFTGALSLKSTSQISLDNSDGSEYMVRAANNGAVELYYDGTKKFETTSAGVTCAAGIRLGGSTGGFDYNPSAHTLEFVVNGTNRMEIGNSGSLIPTTTNSQNLGSTGKRWANIYTNDFHLSNEGSSNDIDGTWGDWTMQEGESDLFLKNNRSGKKYKFNLTEVS